MNPRELAERLMRGENVWTDEELDLETADIVEEAERFLEEMHAAIRHIQERHRGVIVYPTGSRIVLGGLDKPEKLFSTEYDISDE